MDVAGQSAPRAPRWYIVLIVLVGLSAWFYLRPAPITGPTVVRGPTMGTTFTVKVAAGLDPAARVQLTEAVQAVLDNVNAKMSTYVPTSEISRFASAPADMPFRISPETLDVLMRSMVISRASGGAFDITVRPLVDAWGFGPDGRPQRRPGTDTTAQLLERVGYEKLQLDAAARTLRKTTSSVSVDLSAIAKGYAVDKVAEAVEGLGYTAYLVEIGGEMRAGGDRPEGGPWRVGIESPKAGGRQVAKVIELDDRGLATSGNYRNFYIEDGIRYAHTIDPKSGAPVRHRLQSVSVLHPEAAFADGWATALMVLGDVEGPKVAQAEGLAALFMISAPDGELRIEMTDAFRPFLIEKEGLSP